MNIALVVPGGFDPGGQERVIPALLWLTTRLARDHTIWVCVVNGQGAPRTYPFAGATVFDLGATPAGPPGSRVAALWQRLSQALGSVATSLDVVHGWWAGTSGVLAGLLGRRYRVPVVLSIGGGELVWLPEIGYGGRGRWRSRAQTQLALALADVVTGGSRYVLRPLGRTAARWVPLGVDTHLFDGPVARPHGPPWRLIHVGSINRVKDQTTLLDSLRMIVEHEQAVQLDWFGEDTLGGALQRHCATLGLQRHVCFHGVQPSSIVARYYRNAHINLVTSRHESQAVVVGEAAAAGVPTIGTAVGVLPELAPDAAATVAVGDARTLAATTLHALHDPTYREQMGTAAQRWAHTYDADWTAAQFEQIYRTLAR